MIVRYKNKHDRIRMCAMFDPMHENKVLTGDDSMFIKDLDVKIGDDWKDMAQAFTDKDIIPNQDNTYFHMPHSQEAKDRGYND